jgi:uncharacterized protein (DUF2236 family)
MSKLALPSPFPLIGRRLDATAHRMLQPPGSFPVDFGAPKGEPALVAADSVSWRIFKNPVSLFIGGVTAVILELADPGVREGVWRHSAFRQNPVERMQRTGLAAMVTVYAPKSVACSMIARVVRLHDKINGDLPDGESYRANDPALLSWVQATAMYGFSQAYNEYVRHLNGEALDALCREAQPAARLYGASAAPTSQRDMDEMFEAMYGRLENTPVIFEFLKIMRAAPTLPVFVRPLQPMLVRAAVDLVPEWMREHLGLTPDCGLRPWEKPIVYQAARAADRIILPSSPAVLSCLRLGLPSDYLYRNRQLT